MAVLWSCRDAGGRILGGGCGGGFRWEREVRTFASTEGSSITQTMYRTFPFLEASGYRDAENVSIRIPVAASTAGYEAVLIPDLQERVRASSEEAVRLSRLPVRTIDVGRRSVVVDGMTTGNLFALTVGAALEADRLLGEEADASGDSFLAPIQEKLGTPMFASQLDVTAGRTAPSVNATKWDDEGVEARAYKLVSAGCIVDAHTSRRTAGALRAWYASRGEPVVSKGCAVALGATDPVVVRTPHLTVAAGTQPQTVESLCEGMSSGLLVREASWSEISMTPQLGSGTLHQRMMFDIARGKIVARVRGAGVQFRTRPLWNSLSALGDTTTVRTADYFASKGQPWLAAPHGVTAPAAMFRDLDIISTERSL
jgi:TldD protein